MGAWLFLIAVALALGATLAAAMLHDPGYVLVAYGGVTVEASLWLTAGAVLALWLLVALAFAIVRRFRASGANVRAWFGRRRGAITQKRARLGTMLLIEERWEEAEDALLKVARKGDGLLADYLAAARAANSGNRLEQRDAVLAEAREALPDVAFLIDLAHSGLMQEAGQWQRSRTLLDTLRGRAPRHPVVLARLQAAFQALGDWDALAELAPSLPADASDGLAVAEVEAWRARLRNSAGSDVAELHARNTWKAMPKRLHEALLVDYAALASPKDAEAALRRAIEKNWTPAWVRRYAELPLAANVGQRRRVAEGWLQSHPDDPELLGALGRLAAADGQLDLASDYLIRSLEKRSDGATLKALAEVAVASNDLQTAVEYYGQIDGSQAETGDRIGAP